MRLWSSCFDHEEIETLQLSYMTEVRETTFSSNKKKRGSWKRNTAQSDSTRSQGQTREGVSPNPIMAVVTGPTQ